MALSPRCCWCVGVCVWVYACVLFLVLQSQQQQKRYFQPSSSTHRPKTTGNIQTEFGFMSVFSINKCVCVIFGMSQSHCLMIFGVGGSEVRKGSF